MGKYKISIIMSVFNKDDVIKESLDSVFNQTLDDFELICINEGSTHNSFEILEDYVRIHDDKIKIFNQENHGSGIAINNALKQVNGDYIYFFNPDGYLAPNALEKLYNNAISNNSDFVISKIASFGDGEPINYDEPGFEFEKIFHNVDFNNFTFTYKDIRRHVLLSSFSPCTKLYKKKFLDKYGDFKFQTNVDFDNVLFHVQSMLRASKISYVPDFFYHYRLSNSTSINNTASNAPDIFKIVDFVENFLKDNGFYYEFEEDFLIFKITQLTMHIPSFNSEYYFYNVKKSILGLDFYDTDVYMSIIKKNNALKRYFAILSSDSINEFNLNLANDDNLPKVVLENFNKNLKGDYDNIFSDSYDFNLFKSEIKSLKKDMLILDNISKVFNNEIKYNNDLIKTIENLKDEIQLLKKEIGDFKKI